MRTPFYPLNRFDPMNLITEYLIIVERTSAQALYNLCATAADFERLIRADSQIQIAAEKLHFQGQEVCSWILRTREIEGKEQRIFHLRLEFDRPEDAIEIYSESLRAVRKAVGGAGGHIETIWDDVSLHYSKKSYPLIHASESLMRKLIAYFMLTRIGKAWITETSPDTFKEALTRSKRRQYVDTLHQVDFIQLGDFLFRAYQTRDFSELYPEINAAASSAGVDIANLKECIPRSNWDRYFSQIVECTNEHLDKGWKELYELRCIVAHNALASRQVYDSIVRLTSDLNTTATEPHRAERDGGGMRAGLA